MAMAHQLCSSVARMEVPGLILVTLRVTAEAHVTFRVKFSWLHNVPSVFSALYERVRKSKGDVNNYCILFAIFLYLGVYIAIQYLQAHLFEIYQVTQVHDSLLPPVSLGS